MKGYPNYSIIQRRAMLLKQNHRLLLPIIYFLTP
jgi:hypothetical protein